MFCPLRMQRALDEATLQRGHIGGEDDVNERGAMDVGGALELIDEFGLCQELAYVHVVTASDLCSYDGEGESPGVVSGRDHVRVPLA